MKHHIHNQLGLALHCAECPGGTSPLVHCSHTDYEVWGDAEIFFKTLTDELWDWP